jgi:transketolase
MNCLREGRDAVIFATGALVWKSLEAAEKLQADGISAQVVNVSTLKPLLREEVLKYAAGKKAVITAEEATVTGGLGQGIAANIMGEINVPFAQVAINDEFGISAHNYEDLLEKYGLSTRHIYETVKKTLKR